MGDMKSLVSSLLEIFPEASPRFIERLCKGKVNGPGVIDELITQILEGGYPKRQAEENTDQEKNTAKWEILRQMLPDVNPAYLQFQYDTLKNKPDELEKFIEQQISEQKLYNEILPSFDVNSSEEFYNNPNELIGQEMAVEKLHVLKEILPDADPDYLQQHYDKFQDHPDELESFVGHEMNVKQQLDMLTQILPDADPAYLRVQCDTLIDKPDELRAFITDAIERRQYPTLKDYLHKQKISAQQRQYTCEFNVKNFLEVIPNPAAYFENPQRKPSVRIDAESRHYVSCFLCKQFPRISQRDIQTAVEGDTINLVAICIHLENINAAIPLKPLRPEISMPELIQNIPLLQEIAYIQHRNEIRAYLTAQQAEEVAKREEARAAGLLQTCTCCLDEEVMLKDIYECESGCVFCKECVRKGAEVAFGNGKLDFPCFNDCASHFSLDTLQAVLNPRMFSKVALKKQVEEVKAAGIEDLEMCPFCDFASIPPKDDKIFRCLNPECMRESCRLCKEPSHVPLRCEEVEKDDEVKIRTYIENKMTEAMLRKCYKCGKTFIKTEGCNHITCTCGAHICYVCGKPYGKRCGCNFGISSKRLHLQNVLEGAEEAKREMGVDVNPKRLKIDPTLDVREHYNENRPHPPVRPRNDRRRVRNDPRRVRNNPRRHHNPHRHHNGRRN